MMRFSYFRREVLSRYCWIARWAENMKRGGENVAIFNVIAEFPLYRRVWGGAFVPLRYGPIGGEGKIQRKNKNPPSFFVFLRFIL